MNKRVLSLFFKPLSLINKVTKKDEKLIFFYSNLGFRDNVKAFYDYLIENEYNKQYKIVVSINDYENYVNHAPENVVFIDNKSGIKVFLKAKYAFYCFGKYPIKPAKSQMVINLWHGMPLKRVGNMEAGLEKNDYNYFTKIVSTSELFAPILMKCFRCDRDQVIITGQPRTDELFAENPMQDAFIRHGADKVILWLPTYRDEKKEFPVSILNQEQAVKLNEKLKESNTRLIVKLHPLQEVAGKLKQYSNIEFINQEQIGKLKITVYGLLRASDALITDYSSVYFDYMLLNRPIAFTVDDIEKYKNERGFTFDNPYDYMPGNKLTTCEELESFIENVIDGVDEFKEERGHLNLTIHKYIDGKSSKRIAEFVFGRQNG